MARGARTRRRSRSFRAATTGNASLDRLYALGIDAFQRRACFVRRRAASGSSSTGATGHARARRGPRQFARDGVLRRQFRARRRSCPGRCRRRLTEPTRAPATAHAAERTRRARSSRARARDRRAQLPLPPRRDRPRRARRRHAGLRRGAPASPARLRRRRGEHHCAQAARSCSLPRRALPGRAAAGHRPAAFDAVLLDALDPSRDRMAARRISASR